MSAYGELDQAFAGLLYGLENSFSSTRIAAVSIPAGAPVFAYKGDERAAYGYIVDAASFALSADLIASNVITTTIDAFTIAPVTFATSHANTMNLWKNAVNAVSSLEAIIDPSNPRALIVRSKGVTLPAATVTVTLGASQPTVTEVNGSSQVFVGFACHAHKEIGVGGATYVAKDAVSILRDGRIWVNSVGAVKAQEISYLDAAGKIAVSGIQIPARNFVNANSQNLVVVELSGAMADMPLSKF